jgi:hypothetical protein
MALQTGSILSELLKQRDQQLEPLLERVKPALRYFSSTEFKLSINQLTTANLPLSFHIKAGMGPVASIPHS